MGRPSPTGLASTPKVGRMLKVRLSLTDSKRQEALNELIHFLGAT